MNLNPVGWAESALKLVAKIRSDGILYNKNVLEIRSDTNDYFQSQDIAICPRVAGALLAQVPDGTALGGNPRGNYATDLQRTRTTLTQVASGFGAVIAGGSGNQASNLFDVCVGGNNNTAQGQYSAVLGGSSNSASNIYGFVGGGANNVASSSNGAGIACGLQNQSLGTQSFVGGGAYNYASGAQSVVAGGQNNTAGAQYAGVLGGAAHNCNGMASTIIGGSNGQVRSLVGYTVFPASYRPLGAGQGQAQHCLMIQAKDTTANTQVTLTSNESAQTTTNVLTIPNNCCYHFRGTVVSNVTGGGTSSVWTFEGVLKKGTGAPVFVGTVIYNLIAQDAGASGRSIDVQLDTTNNALLVKCTGQTATNIRWVCRLEVLELLYA